MSRHCFTDPIAVLQFRHLRSRYVCQRCLQPEAYLVLRMDLGGRDYFMCRLCRSKCWLENSFSTAPMPWPAQPPADTKKRDLWAVYWSEIWPFNRTTRLAAQKAAHTRRPRAQ